MKSTIVPILITLLTLTACASDEQKMVEQYLNDKQTEQEYDATMSKISGLEGCTAHIVRSVNARKLTVVRCPLSITNVEYQQGKVSSKTTTISN